MSRQRVVQNAKSADTKKTRTTIVEKPPKSHNGYRGIALDPLTLRLLAEARDRS
ncbi:hypothetical protein R8Z50_11380 [Longispora sp. K20-0274]|uniref:hypothetical protein n=1 Tax=Longispora sp. K20-0274 TaxID=3088255 RepID=UPI00399C432E